MTDVERDPVEQLTDDARVVTTRICAAVPPDFAAVVARAQNLASAAAPQAMEEADCVVDIRARVRDDAPSDVLDGLVADARQSIDRMVEQRGMRAIPPLPTPRPRRRLGTVALATGLLAAAAIALWNARAWVALEPTAVDAKREQAFDLEAGERPSGRAIEAEPVAPEPVRRREVEVAPPVEPPAVVEVAPIVEAIVEPAPRVRPDAERLRVLSDEARALWRAGDRQGAEAKFLQVTSSGGRSTLAELAWGDLFALARQLGDDARATKRWRAYLAKFPKGRYADDARAGLCRHAGEARCWSAYLRDFPDGSYRAEARAATKEP